MEVVSFEIAKKLKEKGFRELCTHFYRYGTFRPQEMFCGLRSNTHHKWSFNSMEVKLKDTHEQVQVNMVDAPTISQVLKWLREEKKLHIEIYMYHNCYLWEIYNTEIYDADFTQKSEKYSEIEYATYELAAITGIEYVIDKLI